MTSLCKWLTHEGAESTWVTHLHCVALPEGLKAVSLSVTDTLPEPAGTLLVSAASNSSPLCAHAQHIAVISNARWPMFLCRSPLIFCVVPAILLRTMDCRHARVFSETVSMPFIVPCWLGSTEERPSLAIEADPLVGDEVGELGSRFASSGIVTRLRHPASKRTDLPAQQSEQVSRLGIDDWSFRRGRHSEPSSSI